MQIQGVFGRNGAGLIGRGIFFDRIVLFIAVQFNPGESCRTEADAKSGIAVMAFTGGLIAVFPGGNVYIFLGIEGNVFPGDIRALDVNISLGSLNRNISIGIYMAALCEFTGAVALAFFTCRAEAYVTAILNFK